MNLRIAMTTASFITLTCGTHSFPCSTEHPISPEEVVRRADVIVRATAESLVYAASVPNSSDPDSRVRFKVQEVLRGEMSEDHFDLRGALVDTDDFNDLRPPLQVRSARR